jgi:adenosylcobinamide kinase/adenosylcobinamide-phosphate guanylyltransferase
VIPGTACGTPHLVLGGAKSGKSAFAEKLITTFPPPYLYIATAQALDSEMQVRILRHRERRTSLWRTIECPIELVKTLTDLQGRATPALVDCLTLWLSNLLARSSTDQAEQAVHDLCHFLDIVDYPIILVSNEVGGGIVPENPLARRFRDFAGLAHQEIAGRCKSVTLVVAGLPLVLKSGCHHEDDQC